ncbi:cytochrome C heme lyase [Vibrio tapetis subsp. quintayensis]|uniref:tetratricopeptide repeat protein n=1 Tax=Vibrio tapetis TaxID=52443 RepID=UPI0025B5C390|nr:cytochrome C heme lyase [Vibrio tapetis]MDN3679942.1 cytochrome C heme lyase [Vibrio tapetis subsp. quintayensis]
MENLSFGLLLAFVAFFITFILALVYARSGSDTIDYRMAVTIAGTVSLLSLLLWLPLRPAAPVESESAAKVLTLNEKIEEVQSTLREDPNDGQAWFELGQGYMAKNEFDSASTCFGYAIRLFDKPKPTLFSAKASALYYVNKQSIDQEIQHLLDKALKLNPMDETALTLIANDHYISFRFQKAIDTWQKILDSHKESVDRVSIIRSINQAKQQVQ